MVHRKIEKLIFGLVMIFGFFLFGYFICHASENEPVLSDDDIKLIADCEEELENKSRPNRIEQIILLTDPQGNRKLQVFFFNDENPDVSCSEVKWTTKDLNPVEDLHEFTEENPQPKITDRFEISVIVNLQNPLYLKRLASYIKVLKNDTTVAVKVFYTNAAGEIECVSEADDKYTSFMDGVGDGSIRLGTRNDQFAFIDEIVGTIVEKSESPRTMRNVLLYVTDLTEKREDKQNSEKEYYKLRTDLVLNNLPLNIIRPSDYEDIRDLADGELLEKCAKCYGGELAYIRTFNEFCNGLKTCLVKTYTIDNDMIDQGSRVIKLKITPKVGDDEGLIRAVYIEGNKPKEDSTEQPATSESQDKNQEDNKGENTESTEANSSTVPADSSDDSDLQWKLVVIIGSIVLVVLIIVIVILVTRLNARKKKGIGEKKTENKKGNTKNTPKEKVYVRNKNTNGKGIRFDVYSDGEFTGRAETCVDGSIIIGRGGICDVVIDDPRISRQHMAIEYNGESFFVECLEPSNSTYFNDVKMTHKRRIEKGDRLRVDTLEIVIGW